MYLPSPTRAALSTTLRAAVLALVLTLAGCGKSAAPVGGESGDASAATVRANAEMAATLDLANPQDFEDAKKGLIARPSGKILGADGETLIDLDAFKFVSGAAPATVNPSLWRHAIQNAETGLFKVSEGIYQVRGFDIANMTLIRGKTGWIVVDPLTARESAAAAWAFARQHLGAELGALPVSAVIFTHSHADHFGGALGLVEAKDAAARKLPVVAPAGFMEEATSENVLVGTAMGRRSGYQFGKDLPRSAKGLVDTGLGKAVAYGQIGVLPPTVLISEPDQTLELDGLTFIFHAAPNSEAPAELSFHIPALKAYCGAEILAQTMHNLLPVRGAKVRDALRWAGYLDAALTHAAGAEVYFGQHGWPVWGSARIAEFIAKQRDVYKYTHDQTVRLINAGYTPREIADKVKLPKSLQDFFAARGYYGDLRHNVKAVYQFYIGWYDGNPANLNPLPPEDSAKRHIALIGGADKALAAAREAFDKGEYRWCAELLNLLVFADPGSAAAKDLLARCYEQMGYQAEAATWRNSYLTAAQELRSGPPKKGVARASLLELLAHTPIERFLEAMAAGLDAQAAEGKDWKINLVFSDTGESHFLWLENAVLHHRKVAAAEPNANATLTLTKPLFLKMMVGTAGVKDTLMSDELKISGSRIDLARFFGLIDKATGTFAIVTPE